MFGLSLRGMHRWLIPYLLSGSRRRRVRPDEPLDLLLCICDHYEPKRGGVPMEKARARVQQWVDEYPRLFDRFRDCDGMPPQYTFFYPEDEYEPELVNMIAGLCRHKNGQHYGEVEVHLHHDNDTAENLRRTLLNFKTTLAEQHGLLSRIRRRARLRTDSSTATGRWTTAAAMAVGAA